MPGACSRLIIRHAIALCLVALVFAQAIGCAQSASIEGTLVDDPSTIQSGERLTEALPARVRWRDASEIGMSEHPSHWSGSLRIRALEPRPNIKDLPSRRAVASEAALPEGVYPAEVAEPTQRYIEVLQVRDDAGRLLYDAADGDGTLPRLDIMLGERFHGHYLRRDASVGVGISMHDQTATSLSASGNIVIPRFMEHREVLLPLDTLREANMGTLALGRGRSVGIAQRNERVRVDREMKDQIIEEITISVDLRVNDDESFLVGLAVKLEDGRTVPVQRWHPSGSGGVGSEGWSIAFWVREADPTGQAVALRFTLADRLEFERRPFKLGGVPIEYAPKPIEGSGR